jgi:ribonuclease BN (tRNA processing enzyme)
MALGRSHMNSGSSSRSSFHNGHGLRVLFAPVATGDAVFIDTGCRLYLIDCGAGLDYQATVRSLGHRCLAGIVLTHAHIDHWLALPEALALLASDGWVAKSGTALSPALMRSQPVFEFYNEPVDREHVLDAWESLPVHGLPEISGLQFWDANAKSSRPVVELREHDPRRVHHACIVPVLRCGSHVSVFGADLDGEDWSCLALTLPADIDLLQAPNHGGPPGRMARWVLDDHLRPKIVVVTDAQPFLDDHVEWYSGAGRCVYTLQERRSIMVTMEPGHRSVSVCVPELSRANLRATNILPLSGTELLELRS